MEAPPGFEPGVKDLQSHALPLGYGAVVGTGSLHFAAGHRLRLCPPASYPLPRSSSQSRNCRFVFVAVGVSRSYMNPFLAEQKNGAGDEARTRYLHLGKVALYRMSYARILHWDIPNAMVPPVGIEPTTRGFSVRCSTI